MQLDRREIEEVRASADLVAIVGRTVQLKRQGREWVACCPFHAERTPSFAVVTHKGAAPFWKCQGCGKGGDAIDWLMEYEGLSFRDAVSKLGGKIDMAGERPVVDRAALMRRERDAERAAAFRRGVAIDIWRQARPHQLVARYLESRGITLEPPRLLRLIEDHPYYWPVGRPRREQQIIHSGPCMVAPLLNGDRGLVGVHQTWLKPDGSGKAEIYAPDHTRAKAKLMLGSFAGTAIPLAPSGPVLLRAEGIETALSVMQATGLPAWAVGALPNFRTSWVPSTVKQLIECADADMRDMRTAMAFLEECAAERRKAGVRVRIIYAPKGMDFNDLLSNQGTEDQRAGYAGEPGSRAASLGGAAA